MGAAEDGNGDAPYRKARIVAALVLIGVVATRGILDTFLPVELSDTYAAILLGGAVALLAVRNWRP